MSVKLARVLVLLVLAVVASLSASPQTFEPGQLMLLVIGRSAAPPDPDQVILLEHVQALRNSPGLTELQVATMHFDRPREASFARQVLGVSAEQLPCVCLVQLDSAGQRPLRSLYCWPQVTGAKLAQVDQMADTWARMASQPLPLITPQAPPTFTAPPPSGRDTPVVNSSSPVPPGLAIRELQEAKNRVLAGVNLTTDSWLRATNGKFACCFQHDGNLVVYSLSTGTLRPIWNSQTSGMGAVSMRLATDGVLRMRGPGGQILWEAGSPSFFSHCFLQMQDDGNLVIYRQNGNGLSVDWASKSYVVPR